jgi:adenine specific DNA methylase Mod
MRKHNRKIYYSAGLISIILLPALCVLHLKNNDAFIHYGVISYSVWDGKENEIGTEGIREFLNSKKYKIVNLTGDNNSNKIKLDNAADKIKRMIVSKDSINGIKFHFSQKSQYWTYVRVLDILAIEKAKFYIPYKNDIWFTNPREPKPKKNLKHIANFTCGFSPIYSDQNESLEKWEIIEEICEKYYLPIIVYLMMVFFTVKKIYKLNRIK